MRRHDVSNSAKIYTQADSQSLNAPQRLSYNTQQQHYYITCVYLVIPHPEVGSRLQTETQ